MAADAHAGCVDVRIRLAVRGRDRLGHVDAQRIRVTGELIRERDVDVAVHALGDLRQLRSLRIADAQEARRLECRFVEGFGVQPARFVDRPDDLRIRAQVLEDPARRHALRARREQHLPAVLSERGAYASARRADGDGRFDDDECVWRESASDVSNRAVELREIGAAFVIEPDWHDDDDGVALGNR